MRTIACVLVVLGLAGAGYAGQIGYSNDFSTADQLAPVSPVTGPFPNDPDSPSYQSFNIAAEKTGYFQATLGDPTYGLTEAPLNITNGQISLTWRYDYTGTATPPAGDTMTLWFRAYSGTKGADGKWALGQRADYAITAPVNGGWTTGTAEVSSPNSVYYAGVPFDPTNVYRIRFDLVFWETKYSPAQFSFDQLTITPEPASLALLGLGGLALIRRRR